MFMNYLLMNFIINVYIILLFNDQNYNYLLVDLDFDLDFDLDLNIDFDMYIKISLNNFLLDSLRFYFQGIQKFYLDNQGLPPI